ncbi:hypothetical protein F183_A50180 [Bryobacterales bacterium F-183]|nr:hypothetical protein F183_A50180 [Bryobacterales bacterium F-183]
MKRFAWTVIALWAIGITAGLVYTSQQNIPGWITAAAIPALLVEASLYIASGFPDIRQRFAAIGNPSRQGLLLWILALPPYVIYTVGTGSFQPSDFATLAVLAGALAFWYVLRPRADAAYLTLIAAILLTGVFKQIYPQLAPKANVSILGQLMLIRTSAFAILCIRGLEEQAGFGFLPTAAEWKAGLKQFAWFIPIGGAIAAAVQFATFRQDLIWTRALPAFVATFIGMLWVVALSEELYFRGVLQPLLTKHLPQPRKWMGLVATSVLFGLVHLPFGTFPNWRFAIVAGVAGFFYGRAFEETGTIRSAMVTHALVASIWRVFLKS